MTVFVACRVNGPAPVPDLATRHCAECDALVWIEPPALACIAIYRLRIVCIQCLDRRPLGTALMAPGALDFLQARRGRSERRRAERYLARLNARTN
jgi:hypothetical protein